MCYHSPRPRKPLNIKVTHDGEHHGVSPDKADFKRAPHESIITIAPATSILSPSPVSPYPQLPERKLRTSESVHDERNRSYAEVTTARIH